MTDLDAHIPDRYRELMSAVPVSSAYWVAYSGGLDSTLLLYLASVLLAERKVPIRAIHINHQLSPNAQTWQHQCQQVASTLGIDLVVEQVNVVTQGQGLESAAREARYQAFAKHVPLGAVLLQGHHLNDVAETILFRMMRGAGVAGLAGIPRQRQVPLPADNLSLQKNAAANVEPMSGTYQIYRPLLDVSRQSIETLAANLRLTWIEDESNDSLEFDRNYLRHQVMPVLTARWSSALTSLGQVAQNCRESEELCQLQAQRDLQSIKVGGGLDIQQLLLLTQAQQHNVVKFWLNDCGLGFPGRHQFEKIWTELIPAREDAQPGLHCPGGELRRYRQHLYYHRPSMAADVDALAIAVGGCVTIQSTRLELIGLEDFESKYIKLGIGFLGEGTSGGSGKWSMDSLTKGNLVWSKIRLPIPGSNLTVRQRQGGERIRLLNRDSKMLKKLFQEAAVPEWIRNSYPLLYLNEALIAVPGIAVAEGYQMTANDVGAESGVWVAVIHFSN